MPPAEPTLVDKGFQVAFIVAHRMLRSYWLIRRPRTHGTLVAVWNQGEVLIVKNSYRKEYTLPGGYARSGETPEEAGARELAEECSIYLEPARLKSAYRGEYGFEFRKDDVAIVEVELETRPPVVGIDNREVVWAGFKSPSEILGMPIVPHLRDYLQQRASRT